MKGDSDTNCRWCDCNGAQRFGKVTGGFKIRRRIETIQATALLRLARILSRALEF